VRAAETLNMRYDIIINGLQVFDLRYRAHLSPGSYTASADVDPAGFAGLFVRLKLDLEAKGKIARNRLAPSSFTMVTTKKKRARRYDVTWLAGKKPTTKRSNQIGAPESAAIEAAVGPDHADPLSMLLRAGVQYADKPCSHTERVYNGKEVYDLVFSMEKRDTFGKKDGGIYRGPSFKCKLNYRPVAGLKPAKLAKALANPAVFMVWFAPVRSSTAGRQILVPVGATGKIDGKKFVAYTHAATIGGHPLNAQSVARQ